VGTFSLNKTTAVEWRVGDVRQHVSVEAGDFLRVHCEGVPFHSR